MRIMVLNKAVGVGKSTVARHMLAGPLEAMLISIVGTFELDGHPDSRCLRKNSSELPRILNNLAHITNAVVDIGSEDHDAVMAQLEATPGYYELFDYIILPVTRRAAAQDETIDTLMTLANHGVPARKIRVLFNMLGCGRNGDVYDDFDALLDYYGRGYNDDRPRFEFRPEAILNDTEAITILQEHGHAIPERIVSLARADYRKQLDDPAMKDDATYVEVLTNLIKYETNLKRLKREIDDARSELLS